MLSQGRETASTPAGKALEVMWTERLARNIIRRLLPDPVLGTDAPAGVEVVMNRWQGRYLVHLMNHYAGDPANPSHGGERLVLRNVILRLDTARLGRLGKAYALPSRQAVETRVQESCIEIVVPDFDLHCLLLVE
jgi:hypothetical protein